MPYLKRDVYSMLNVSRRYGLAGQEVTVISCSENVRVVELKDAPYTKFPCLAMDLSDEKGMGAAAMPTTKQDEGGKKGRWKNTPPKQDQPTLF